jgi:Uma2 family endonuclease
METTLAKELFPDVRGIITEDDEPVDNIFSEKQQRLLAETLHTSWNGGGRTFFAAANVGVFHSVYEPPLVPDVFVSMDVQPREEWHNKDRKTYFCWEFGKQPEIAIEIVSNRKGGEMQRKFKDYARLNVWYYVVFDPFGALSKTLEGDTLRIYELHHSSYTQMHDFWLEEIGLGLRLWEGEYEGWQGMWIRWCDERGTLLPTGKERAEQERVRTEQERVRAEQERVRAEQERVRAEQERVRAEQEHQRANEEQLRADTAEATVAALQARLRAAGLDANA